MIWRNLRRVVLPQEPCCCWLNFWVSFDKNVLFINVFKYKSKLTFIIKVYIFLEIIDRIQIVSNKLLDIISFLCSIVYQTSLLSWCQRYLCRRKVVILSPVGWNCRIHWLLLGRRVRPMNECPAYDTKQSDGEVPMMQVLWGIRSTPSLPLLTGPLWPGMVAPDMALSKG